MSTSLRARLTAALLVITLATNLAVAQDAFVAIPPQLAEKYHFDFARIYFASPEAEQADRSAYYASLNKLEQLKGKVTASAANLLKALQLNDRLQIQFNRHYSYLYLRSAVNTTDEASLADSSALDAEVNTRTAFVRHEILEMSDRVLATYLRQLPALKEYEPGIDTIRRYRPYTLSLKEEEVLGATAPNNDWSYDLYAKLRDVKQPDATERDLYAFALTRLAAARTRIAHLHHFPDAASEVYFKSYWTRDEVDRLVDQITAQADLYRRYQKLRSDHAKALAGTAAPKPLRFTIDQATETIRSALAPLGPDYGRELAALLDPANGRMDIVPGSKRKRGGFSQGFIGTDSVFYSGGFAGSYNDLRVLAHESTHAIHRQLMNHNHVLPVYAEGPHYLFEAFAIFNEFLLADYCYAKESDPLRKQYYLEQFLENKGTAMFYVAPEVALEHAVYSGVAENKLKTADDLDALTKKLYSPFSLSPERNEQMRARWMDLSLMWEDPFYYVNYIYGAILALNLYEMYQRDPKTFAPKYIALMRNGFNAPPDVLLKRFLDVDLHDKQLVDNAVAVVVDRINKLESAYRK